MPSCWNCNSETGGAHFCPSCGSIQPVSPADTLFSFMGLGNELTVDTGELEKKYYALSREFHPDFFLNRPGKERLYSLDRSACLNRAFSTLRDPFLRAQYVVDSFRENPGKQNENGVPQELLLDVMDIHESIEEYQAEREPRKRKEIADGIRDMSASLRETESGLLSGLKTLFAGWDEAPLSPGDGERLTGDHRRLLERMDALLKKRNYIAKLLKTVDETLTEESGP